jgi:ATP phosphoribosyltransferase
VSTGATLKANNLVEVETIDYISSRLIVGSTAMKLKRQELLPLIEIFANTVKKE